MDPELEADDSDFPQHRYGVMALMTGLFVLHAPARAADEPDLIFKPRVQVAQPQRQDSPPTASTTGRWRAPRHFTVPEKGGFKGWIGVAEKVSDISLSCWQIGPIRVEPKG